MDNQDPQVKADKKKLQMEILMKESDIKKNERAKIDTEVILRDLKHKEALIQADILSYNKKMEKIQADETQMQNEIIKIKHQFNSLGRDTMH